MVKIRVTLYSIFMNLKNYILIIICFFSINLVGITFPNTIDNWNLGYYVDEFGDKTDNWYVKLNATNGKFSNSVTNNSKLRVVMYFDDVNDAPWMRIYEYGTIQVKNEFYDRVKYPCKFKNNNDKKIYTVMLYQNSGSGTFELGSGYNYDIWLEQFLLAKNNKIDLYQKFSCYNQDFPTITYKFHFDYSGISEVKKIIEDVFRKK